LFARKAAPFTAALAVVAAIAFPAAASAADVVVSNGATGTGPEGADCSAAAFTQIQPAVTAANPGDRVLVCEGTYNESQIVIDKELTLIGAGQGQTIVDAGDATNLPTDGTLRVTAPADVEVVDITILNAGRTAPAANAYHVFAKSTTGNPLYRFDGIAVIGEQVGTAEDYGFYTINSTDDLEIVDSTITGTDANPILLEQHAGAVTLQENLISPAPQGVGDLTTSAVALLTYGNVNVTAGQRFNGNLIDASGQSGISIFGAFQNLAGTGRVNALDIVENEIVNVGGTGSGIALRNQAAVGADGQIAVPWIARNLISGSGPASRGVRLTGFVSNPQLRSNSISGLGTGLEVASNEIGPPAAHAPTNVQAHYNRIAGNTVGVRNLAPSQVYATNNWWGCNEGPNLDGCDTVVNSGGGSVLADPWLILNLFAIPTTIQTGGQTSDVLAEFNVNSDGVGVAPDFPDGVLVTFGTTLGTIDSPVLTESGGAGTTLTSGSEPGTANVSATLDAETLTTPVVFEAPLTPDVPDEPIVPDQPVRPGERPTCLGSQATIVAEPGTETVGTNGDDVIVGTSGNDRIQALGGDDLVCSLGGDDVVRGGEGNDAVKTGGGKDRVFGEAGNDSLRGGGAGDVLRGGADPDRLQGQRGNDRLFGGAANDLLNGGTGRDLLDGNAGVNRCISGTVLRNCQTR
jgi:Ca2+-binding RTX toxin-like protein